MSKKVAENKSYIRNADEKGSINISEDVIAVIAAAAALEVEGVHSLFFAHGRDLTYMLSKKGLAKDVKLTVDGDDIVVEMSIIVEMGYSVSEIGAEIQKGIISAVEAAAGVTVRAVNVHICGISPKRASRAL